MRRMAQFKNVRILEDSQEPLRMVNIVDDDYVGDAPTWLETFEISTTFETVRDSGGMLSGFKIVKIEGRGLDGVELREDGDNELREDGDSELRG